MMSNGAIYILYLLGTLALGFLGGWLVARNRYLLDLDKVLTFYQKPELVSSKEKETATNYFALGYYYCAIEKDLNRVGTYYVYGSSMRSGEVIEAGSKFMTSNPNLGIYMMNRMPKTPTS